MLGSNRWLCRPELLPSPQVLADGKGSEVAMVANTVKSVQVFHPGGNPVANLKSISHRCHPILVAFVWELTK